MEATLYVIGLTVLRLGVPLIVMLAVGTFLQRRVTHSL